MYFDLIWCLVGWEIKYYPHLTDEEEDAQWSLSDFQVRAFFFFFLIFIFLFFFIFGCVGSSFLCEGFL